MRLQLIRLSGTPRQTIQFDGAQVREKTIIPDLP
ncbi:MAG: hypothetical protein UW45_C0020G0020 [Parcubacteria group bacterium GW2011_GWC2_44_22]|nr:MAG: hypothetical protein UW45_C0020G0020 [Parcubacteria group bacterium GW2011_GWC2_44_22]